MGPAVSLPNGQTPVPDCPGISTEKPLAAAADALAKNNLRLEYLQLSDVYKVLPEGLFTQSHGSHADERETSLILFISPRSVQMEKAVCDGSEGSGRLSRVPGVGTYSASGVFGDARLATREKGEQLARIMVTHVCGEISSLMLDRQRGTL